MNISYPLSMILGFSCIIISITLGGELSDFLSLSSVFIVVGGVTFSVLASYPFDRIRSMFQALHVVMRPTRYDLDADIEQIVEIANIARRHGLLSLEDLTEDMDEPFLKKGILMTIDQSDSELIRSILETELSVTKERHANNRAILDTAAAYSPAFGMLGTLIGLINMLTSLNDADALGPNMSVALVTTFYGVILANMVFNPLSKRLRSAGVNEYLHKELILEGIMAVQNGENPRIIRSKLNAYLSNAMQSYQEGSG